MANEFRRAELYPGFEVTSDDILADIGCGRGDVCIFAGNLGADVIAVDVELPFLEFVRTRMALIPARSFLTVLSTDSSIPLADDSTTAIVVREVMEHVDDPEHFLLELYRVSKAGGRILLSVPDSISEQVMKVVAPPDYFQKPQHQHIYERERLAKLVLNAGYQIASTSYTGFYWSIWWIIRMAIETHYCPGQDGPVPELLAGWEQIWNALQLTKSGPQLVAALERVMPKSQVLILRKPTGHEAALDLEGLDCTPSVATEDDSQVVSRRAYETLLSLYRENQRHLEALRQSALTGNRVS